MYISLMCPLKNQIRLLQNSELTNFRPKNMTTNKLTQSEQQTLDTQLFIDVCGNHLGRMADTILRGAHVNCAENRSSPLAAAAFRSNLAAVELLLEAKASADHEDAPALHWACDSEWSEAAVVNRLIEAKADVNRKDSFGMTPLLYAAGRSNGKIVQLLLLHRADTTVTNKSGQTALEIAKKHFENREENIKLLSVPLATPTPTPTPALATSAPAVAGSMPPITDKGDVKQGTA